MEKLLTVNREIQKRSTYKVGAVARTLGVGVRIFVEHPLHLAVAGLEHLEVAAAHLLPVVLEPLLDVAQRGHLDVGVARGSAVPVLGEVDLLDVALGEELFDVLLVAAEGQAPDPDNVVLLGHPLSSEIKKSSANNSHFIDDDGKMMLHC